MNTLRELLTEADKYAVNAEIRRAYGNMDENTIVAHGEMIEHLLSLPPMPQDDREAEIIAIEVAFIPDEDGDRAFDWYDVSGKDAKGTTWAIEFMRWEQWLSIPVVPVRCDLSASQLVAHCIYEMTFCGFEQEDIQGTRAEIYDLAQEIKDELS